MDITNCNFQEKTFFELEELELLLKNNFTKSSNTNNILSNLYEYLDTFAENVKQTLVKTNTKTGDIPYRGEITIHNLGELFKIMPDLYDYLKIQYSYVESGGDVVVNDILDGAKNRTLNEKSIEQNYIEYEKYFDYIEQDYYYDYLPGYLPVPFSIDKVAPYCTISECGCNCLLTDEKLSFPRDWYWWKTYKFAYCPVID
jgi:hypothetical protein